MSKSTPSASVGDGLAYARCGVLLEVQLGECSPAINVLAEHVASFICNEIDVGVRIAPAEALNREMGECTGSFEQCLAEIQRYPRGQPAVPFVLVGVAP